MTKRKGVGAVGSQDSLGIAPAGRVNQAWGKGLETGLTALGDKSLKIVFAASGRFSRISLVNSPDLLAKALTPSANLAFSSRSTLTSSCMRAACSLAYRFSVSAT